VSLFRREVVIWGTKVSKIDCTGSACDGMVRIIPKVLVVRVLSIFNLNRSQLKTLLHATLIGRTPLSAAMLTSPMPPSRSRFDLFSAPHIRIVANEALQQGPTRLGDTRKNHNKHADAQHRWSRSCCQEVLAGAALLSIRSSASPSSCSPASRSSISTTSTSKGKVNIAAIPVS
jgi:hypothetical protein